MILITHFTTYIDTEKKKNVSCGIAVIKCLPDPETTDSKTLIYMDSTESEERN